MTMKPWFERHLPVFNAEGTGGAAAPAATPAAAGTATPAPAPAPTSPATGGAAAAGGTGGSSPPAAATPYRPDGLGDALFGKDDRETIDRLHAAVKGYRDRDATRGVPDAPDAYRSFKLDDVPETIRPHIEGLAKDPLFETVAKVALAEGVPVASMHKMTAAIYQAAQEAGVLEPPIDPAVERAQLLPESAKSLPKSEQDAAIDARMQANEDWIKLLTKPGADGKAAIDGKVADHALLMLMDTAAGNLFLESIRNMVTGGNRAQPLTGQGGQAGQTDIRAALREKMAAPEMNPQHPKFNRAAYDALDAEFKRAFGD